MRIAKWIAYAGLCSRRVAETWIQAGRVQINGQMVQNLATIVTSNDKVTVDNKPVQLPTNNGRLWLYYKPTGLVTTHKDPQGRPTVFSQIGNALPRVVSVGRLDLNSEGLLLLTDYGPLARYLELPSTALERVYRVRVFGRLPVDLVERLAEGITIEGHAYRPISAHIERGERTNTWLILTLDEGKNREIRKIMTHFGLQVNRLIRIQYGPFFLGDLKPNQIMQVPQERLEPFLEAIGKQPHEESAIVLPSENPQGKPSKKMRTSKSPSKTHTGKKYNPSALLRPKR